MEKKTTLHTDKTIIKQNIMLYEFVSGKKVYDGDWTLINNLMYHYSYDKLMPVIQKINSTHKRNIKYFFDHKSRRGSL